MTHPQAFTFQAIWPIVDEAIGHYQLVAQAQPDLELLTARAHACLVGPGRWSVEPATAIPGAGHLTEQVLVYRAPARPAATRPYWKAGA